MTETDSQIFDRAMEIFWELCQRPEHEREAQLAELCGEHEELRREVESLLKHHEDREGCLAEEQLQTGLHQIFPDILGESSTPGGSNGTPRASEVTQTNDPIPPDRIDHYELIERIGEGGFGEVYLAQQIEPIRRKVALKIIKLGMDTQQIVQRFEAERQTLALMEHPAIATVFDAGATDRGRPFFVMEYVEGTPITRFANENHLTVEERIELFIEVCEGLQHAHQKGIIHRDIKPSNILVMTRDGKARPKIIDFGIAKAMRQDDLEKTFHTHSGQLVGTPTYMSPEQAENNPDNIDSRTDLYSLGVVLYELLTGELPFDPETFRGKPFRDIQEIICHQQPPKPSTRVQRTGSHSAASIAESRRSEIKLIQRKLRGDLDWITMRAMEKDRERRYASASEFAADLRRYLNHEPVSAGPPDLVYRFRKFISRNRTAAIAAVLMLALIVASFIGIASVAYREANLRVFAEQKSDESQQLAYRLSISAAQAALDIGDGVSAREHLETAPDELRGWEWHHLGYRGNQSLREVWFDDPSDRLADLVVTPNNRRVMTLRESGLLQTWSLETGELWSSVSTGLAGSRVTLDQTGDRLLIYDREIGLQMINPTTGETVWTLEGANSPGPIPFHPTEPWVIVGGQNGFEVQIVDARTGRKLRAIEIDQPAAWQATFSPDGQFVLYITDQYRMAVIDVETGLEQWNNWTRRAEFSASGEFIMATSGFSGLKSLRVDSGERNFSYEHSRSILRFAARSDFSQVAVLDQSGITILDGEFRQTLTSMPSLHPHATAMRYSHDDRFLVVGYEGGFVVWDADVIASPTQFEAPHRRRVDQAAFAVGGRVMATRNWGFINLWNTQTGELRWQNYLLTARTQDLQFSPDGGRLAVIGRPDLIYLLDARDGSIVQRYDPFEHSQLESIAWPRPGSDLYVLVANGEIWRMNPATGELRDEQPLTTSAMNLMRMGRERQYLAWIEPDAASEHALQCRVLDTTAGEIVATVPLSREDPTAMAVDERLQLLVIGSANGAVHAYSIDAPHTPYQLQSAGPEIYDICLLAEVNRVAVGFRDQSVRLWDTDTRQRVFSSVLQTGRPRAIGFDEEEQALLVSGTDMLLKRYDTRTPRAGFTQLARSRQIRDLVDPLYQELEFTEDVRAAIESDDAIPEDLRADAIEYAERFGEHIAWFHSDALIATRYPDQEAEEYETAARKARRVALAWPNLYIVQVTRGIAEYRAGNYAAARDVLADAVEMDDFDDVRAYPFLAKAHYQLGEEQRAREILEIGRRAADSGEYTIGEEFRAFMREAEQLIRSASL
ncbi:MAG: hypothetical protein EA377_06000 [Phycisphaerales bacterium]|nr:MAG: hypothetical protein EA377_06000 [Phycisphaerales bacterium]